MGTVEIILIIVGGIIFLLGFILSGKKGETDEEVQLISEAEIKKLVEKEASQVEEKVASIVDETVNYAMEKAERSMEKISNEKIMAVGEYSDTVLAEINKNHKEVVFLYDMLNDKHDNLVATINEISSKTEEIKQTVKDAEITAGEAAKKVDEALAMAEDAIEKLKDAQIAASEAQDAVEEALETVMRTVQNAGGEVANVHDANAYRAEVVEDVKRALERQDMSAIEKVPVTEEQALSEKDRLDSMLQQFVASQNTEAVEVPSQDAEIVQLNQMDVKEGFEVAKENAFTSDSGNDSGTEDDEWSNRGLNTPGDTMSMSATAMSAIGLGENIDNKTENMVAEETDEPEVDFQPIRPRRVEIIHEPDGDYIANPEEMSTSAAFAEMGFFANNQEETKRKTKSRKNGRTDNRADDFGALDIQFTKRKEKGRNSNERILELHKAGKSNMAIAKELGLGLGEVKLVIDLFEGM